MTDREILVLYRTGQHEKAFRELVESYKERLYWHIRRFTCSHEDTDDLLQETFIKVWAALPTFREEARLYTWLYRIATNEALNFIRKNRIKAMFSFEPIDAKILKKIDEDTYFDGNELQRELMKAVQKLPEKQRIVFNMRYFDEMKYEDMAEILKTSAGSLKASYHHAYVKIKSELEKKF
jgi:RNA polymerase sigma factor, sigma-70 family